MIRIELIHLGCSNCNAKASGTLRELKAKGWTYSQLDEDYNGVNCPEHTRQQLARIKESREEENN
jgi:hypothetical protein